MTVDATTFRQAYGVLQKHAITLRDQKEPNIDDLLSIVTESVQVIVQIGYFCMTLAFP